MLKFWLLLNNQLAQPLELWPGTPDSLRVAPPHPSVSSCLKRGLDIVGSLVGLSITLLLLLPIAIAIQLDNPGPVFYSQVRCGYRGRPFRLWKFRSMVANADALKHQVENQAQGLIFKNANDPRITRVGKFLRRTSLDEFPQFWNVLRGDMSLVGTRPPTLDEVSQYSPHHWQRLNVKPGLTGRWQARGRSQVNDFEAIVRMDLDYQAQWSLWHDMGLIMQTLGAVVLSRGAY
ncbi:sugar transferase [Nodosilinea sp. PGN35]|uniref:sugar transferase n=1 Tax=Nodosilinea sp. PGN35 TaxID=3020489 RepID=UPI0023B2E71C|nr:sugar transferase [Nodosilinea sp. TSF1-S3]MDF0367307.1 sugar transferase [Nodosilinea sp. TSF1-S3]